MDNQNQLKFRIISIKLAKKLLTALIFVFVFDFFLFPAPAMASELDPNVNIIPNEIIEPIFNNSLPENNELNIIKTGKYAITAYSSELGQCDNSPCITANGFNVCEHGIEDTIAANFLKFGTKIKIPELFGDRVFVVRDRMNSRYDNRLDIWMADKTQAKKFGFKYATIEVLAAP